MTRISQANYQKVVLVVPELEKQMVMRWEKLGSKLLASASVEPFTYQAQVWAELWAHDKCLLRLVLDGKCETTEVLPVQQKLL